MSVSTDHDHLLAERAANGDADAFDALVRRSWQRATAVAYEWTSDVNQAPDVVLEAFARAHRSIHTFRGDCAFTTWLHRIVVNSAIDANHRGRARAADVPLSFDLLGHLERSGKLAETMDAASEQEIESERLGRIKAGMERLSRGAREILLLCYFRRQPYIAIAEQLGIKVGTVRSRLNRARGDLRRELGLPERRK